MKWRRDTCLPRPSSFAHLKLREVAGPRAGVAEGSLRCRQFWSNICPRKNKSPLSLTTGRASLVSNRALLNRRRITDLREPVHSDELTVSSFRSRSTSSYPSRPIFFFSLATEPQTKTWSDVTSPYLRSFYRKFYRIFTIIISLPSFVRIRSSTTVLDKCD